MPESPWSRDRDAQPQSKRQSITDRILGTFGQSRKDTAASPPRRASSSSTGQSPIPRIRQWLDTCKAEHGFHCCADPDDDNLTWRPLRLVDSVERRLVPAKPTDRYAALSYVWGVATPRNGPQAAAQLLSANLDAFQQSLPDTDIPRTILDAIWLAKKLGIRYIWVDRLCIVQDDEHDRTEHMHHMAFVFANAHLTIVAAHGDANTGLLSLDPRRPPRGAREGAKDHNHLLMASRWNTRAWTLQELLYSRRAVFLFEDTVTWECHCHVWQGSTAVATQSTRRKRHECANRISPAALGFQHSPWPDLDEYARIAMDYSCRRLTLVDDTLPAFAGITHVLSRVFAGGFVYGMPLMFLDIALLWRPQATIRRRALSRPPFLPSWSWMGWWFDGVSVDVSLWRAAADYVEETRATKRDQGPKRFQASHSFRIRPTVAWNLTNRAHAVRVANNGLRYRELRSRRAQGAPLPPGWSRAGSQFRHDSDELTVFKYPIPVEEIPEDADYETQPGEEAHPGPLLSFKTTCGFFEVDYAISMVPRGKPNPPIAVGNIWSRGNQWMGEFRAHDGWLGVQSSNYDGDERLEFVAISTATERRGSHVFSAERFEEKMDADEMIDIVNVLWIERIAGVACRRGIGHVLQKAWEAEAPDEVDVLLG
ncbi:hypothetical protein G6O67_006910 [Ophiocordyceps sinensis]|uniref:Heterokaryon incompatibility domain-containing protein n=2 Tax=Ophiocordyceps sinensis TaxID=72228 RepID=A0A8H4PLF0_9HYPO|nr:hypothetical protein G6O67_006910 [Ophiocordyceps sinensis]